MFIQPDTEIRLLRGCPLDSSYEHTVYFEYPSEQLLYFSKFPDVRFTKQTYQRYSLGVLTVQAKAEDIFDCNYLMFKNAAFENKWFYAFITKVEYVNNITSRVHYKIDVMQTWMCEAIIQPCFVEREHSKSDDIGENLVHEDVYFGPYTYENTVIPHSGGLTMQDLSVVIMFNPTLLSDFADEGSQLRSNVYSGTFQGVSFLVVRATPDNVGYLDNLFASVDFVTFGGFLSAFMMPSIFVPSATGYNEYNKIVNFSVTRNSDFDGYVPKNKKLFTYPYTCANLTSNRNEGNDYAFEHFTNGEVDKATFAVTGNFSANPSAVAFAKDYKNIDQFIQGAVSIPSYPMCTWGSEGITEWINNHLFKGMATAGLTAAMGHSPLSGLTAGAIAETVTNVSPLDAAGLEIITTPSAVLSAIGMARAEFDSGCVHGDGSGDVLIGTPTGRTITARIKRITREYAEIVDGYFSRFGYATMKTKEPNRNSRPFWNYVKTKGCAITGSVPAEDAKVICAIYDRGITFWNKYAKIGDYVEQDNSVKKDGD